ncbi:MAG: hypothetical protein JRH15_18860 [Deltaproteobacteria bacterium]|nr:hypothetical protein [Deltaproteobacteria bacterium]
MQRTYLSKTWPEGIYIDVIESMVGVDDEESGDHPVVLGIGKAFSRAVGDGDNEELEADGREIFLEYYTIASELFKVFRGRIEHNSTETDMEYIMKMVSAPEKHGFA